MKFFIFFMVSLFAYSLQAQNDTTALRFISISNHGNITFFLDDTTDFYLTNMSFNVAGNATGHGLFVNPADGLLYAVADPDNDYATTTRKVYQINPLTGESTLIMDLGDYTTSATITSDGRLFTIDGNGGATPGAVNEVDLTGLTQTQVAISNVTSGEPRAMVFNPNDTSLYIYSSFIDSVFIMKLDTWTETKQYAYVNSWEVHGGYYRDNQFWLGCYGGQIIHVNLADSLGGPVIETNTTEGNMALSEFRMLEGPTQIDMLPGAPPIILRSFYGSSSLQWYRNDTLISGATADTLLATVPGNYKLLAEIDTSTNFIWSETIQVRAPGITDLRFIAITTWDAEDILFFNNDTTDLYAVTSTINDGNNNFTSHGIFVNPNDGCLYGMADPQNFTARSLYKINPLTGQFDSIMVVGDHPTSIAITPEGRAFAIEGNGGATPGAINEIDLTNLTQTQVAVSNVTFQEPRGMVYNPNDSSLYIYSSFIDSVFVMKIDDWTETRQYADFGGSVEIHGGYYRDNQFWLGCYGGEIVYVNLTNSLGGGTLLTTGYNLMDLTEFNLLKESTNIGICLNVPVNVVLHARYSSNSYFWYKNDTLISGANADSLVVTDYGNYKLLTEIDTSNNYIWSETVNVYSLNVPNVSVNTADTLWCPGDTIQLSGSAGGTSQWYLDGVAIAGADSNVYFATYVGYYNMTKTNLNGCTDSASVGITIVDDPGCPNSVEEEILAAAVSVYPTPFTNIINILTTDNKIQKVIVTDIKGVVLSEKPVNGTFTTIDASSFNAGVYFLKIISTDGVVVKQIVKQ